MQRRDEWKSVRLAGLVEATSTATGVDLVYRRSATLEPEIRRLVVAEQRCCAPDAIGWELLAGDDTLTVRVTTSDQLRARIDPDVIFDILRGVRDDRD